MSLIIRRKPNGPGVEIANGDIIVRVVKVDPDNTVHLAFIADRKIRILREELLENPPADYVRGRASGNR